MEIRYLYMGLFICIYLLIIIIVFFILKFLRFGYNKNMNKNLMVDTFEKNPVSDYTWTIRFLNRKTVNTLNPEKPAFLKRYRQDEFNDIEIDYPSLTYDVDSYSLFRIYQPNHQLNEDRWKR